MPDRRCGSSLHLAKESRVDEPASGSAGGWAKGVGEPGLVDSLSTADVVEDLFLVGSDTVGCTGGRVFDGHQIGADSEAPSGGEHRGGRVEQRADVVVAYPPGEFEVFDREQWAGRVGGDDVASFGHLRGICEGEDQALYGARTKGNGD